MGVLGHLCPFFFGPQAARMPGFKLRNQLPGARKMLLCAKMYKSYKWGYKWGYKKLFKRYLKHPYKYKKHPEKAQKTGYKYPIIPLT